MSPRLSAHAASSTCVKPTWDMRFFGIGVWGCRAEGLECGSFGYGFMDQIQGSRVKGHELKVEG
jgi:hypothetical protein